MRAATCFVNILGTDDDLLLIRAYALSAACLSAANYAYSREFSNGFGNSHKERHWAEGLGFVIHIKACDYYAQPTLCEAFDDFGDFFVKKLRFIDAHNAGGVI